jgi:hypothetical protein
VVDEDEAHAVLVAPQSLHDAVDAIAGKSEDGVDPPIGKAFNKYFGRDLAHGDLTIDPSS